MKKPKKQRRTKSDDRRKREETLKNLDRKRKKYREPYDD